MGASGGGHAVQCNPTANRCGFADSVFFFKKTEVDFTGYSKPRFSHLQNGPDLRMVTHAYKLRALEFDYRRTTLITQLVNCLPCKYEESSLKA